MKNEFKSENVKVDLTPCDGIAIPLLHIAERAQYLINVLDTNPPIEAPQAVEDMVTGICRGMLFDARNIARILLEETNIRELLTTDYQMKIDLLAVRD